MGLNCGIVGLPNVGKSTIFNALTAQSAAAANYPFCTIEPNTGIVPVPDQRLDILSGLAKSEKILPTTIEFVDIAGLVKGASEGEGLGNQFLGHIRSVDAIAHVVRCFDDDNIIHVHGKVSPRDDIEIIETELILADLAAVEGRFDRVQRAAKSGDKELRRELDALEIAKGHLAKGMPLRVLSGGEEEYRKLGLLTAKPMLYVANVSEKALRAGAKENSYLQALLSIANQQQAPLVVICGAIEAEIAGLAGEERALFLEDLGLETSGLDRLAMATYKLLNLITFFTVGPKETRAWTISIGTNARSAAGVIHSDFEKGFIRAEVIGYEDYVTCRGEAGAKDKGLLRVEGKDYVVKDGDVMHFRFNV